MDSRLRLKAVSALRNLMFLADTIAKESIIRELTVSTLASLICGKHLLFEGLISLNTYLVDIKPEKFPVPNIFILIENQGIWKGKIKIVDGSVYYSFYDIM